MNPKMPPTSRLAYVEGRLMGLAGTVRYDLPEPCRNELRSMAELIQQLKNELAGSRVEEAPQS